MIIFFNEIGGEKHANEKSNWNFRHIWIGVAISATIQAVVLPCMCSHGDARGLFAVCFDALIVARTWIAWHFKEKNKAWIFYLILMYSSPIWIWLLSFVNFA